MKVLKKKGKLRMRILFAVMNPDGKYVNLTNRAIYVASIPDQGSLFSVLNGIEEKINDLRL